MKKHLKWRTQEFKALEREWNARLKQSGLQDIEKNLKGERVLIRYDYFTHRAAKVPQEVFKERAQYFSLLFQHFSQETSFADDSDRLIMLRTSEGRSIQEISKELIGLGRAKHNRDTIRYIRRRYENKWGLRIWMPHQMVSRRVIKS